MPATTLPASPTRRNWFLWGAALLFAVAVVSVPMVIPSRKHSLLPGDVIELAEMIESTHPEWVIVSSHPDNLNDYGFYLCKKKQSLHDLNLLVRSPEKAELWGGVVFVEMRHDQILSDELTFSWQENGLLLGKLVFFGDASFLKEIRLLLTKLHGSDCYGIGAVDIKAGTTSFVDC